MEKAAALRKEARKAGLSKVEVEPLFEEFVDFDTFSKSDFRVVKVHNARKCLRAEALKFTLNDGSNYRLRTILSVSRRHTLQELVGRLSLQLQIFRHQDDGT